MAIGMSPAVAVAQTETLITAPTLPFEYDRDRNESVNERLRPEYDQLGIRTGGFLLYPRLDLGAGYSNNIYLAEIDQVDAPFAEATATLRATSDWSRHQLSASVSGTARRYLGESARNEDSWRSALLGRYDISSAASITGEAQAAKVYETPFSGGADSPFAALSSYQTTLLGVRGRYSAGRARFQLGLTHSTFDFNDISLPTGGRIDQSDRDRTIDAVAVQGEYALSPAISTFTQLSYAFTDYDDRIVAGFVNRKSDGYRALAGVNFDLAAFVRGAVAIGYTQRDFRDSRFDDVSGFSAEARVEWFLSQLTTVTVGARRIIEDSSLADVSAFFDNRLSVQVDHELLNNLILGASVEYAYQDYINSDRANDVYRVGTSARYLVSNLWSLGFQGSYGRRDRDGLNNEGTLNELRGAVTLSLHR